NGAIVLVARQLVLARLVAIDETVYRPPANQMLPHDLRHVVGRYGPIPNIVGINNDHGAMAALVEAAGMIDAHAPLESRLGDERLQPAVNAAPIAVNLGAVVAAGADEDVALEKVRGSIITAALAARLLRLRLREGF